MLRVGNLSGACVILLVTGSMFVLPFRSLAIPIAATEDLLLSNPAGGDPGRMWPGFAAGEVSRQSESPVPRAASMTLPAPALGLGGGDLSFPSGSPNSPNMNFPSMSNLGSVAGMMMPISSGAVGAGMMGSNLSSLMGMAGLLNLLEVLPNIASMFNPQQLWNAVTNVAAMAAMITQLPQFIGEAFTGLYQGLVGLGSGLVQAVTQPFTSPPDASPDSSVAGGPSSNISAAQGGVASSTAEQSATHPSANLPPGSTSLHESAQAMIGTSTRGIPNTQNGQVGCAAAACMVFKNATGQRLVPDSAMELRTDVMYRSLRNDPRFVQVGWADAQPGDVAITARNHSTGRAGHVGYVTNGSRIISNSSDGFAGSAPGTIQNNYTFDGWQSGVTTRNPDQSGVFRYTGGGD